MKRKSDDKQRTISSFFASAPTIKPKSKPPAQQQQHGTPTVEAAAAAEGPPHSKRHKPSNDVEVIDISDADDRVPEAVHAAAAPHTTAGTAGREAPYRANSHAAPPAIPDVRNGARHSKAQAKLVGAPGAASLAEPGAPSAAAAFAAEVPAGAGGSSSRRQQQQQQPKYTPLEQQVVALKAAHPGVSLHIGK
jgi:hypothetical protein